jgi:sigma-B regulation protein RsbU (phosphoserine phosphatase)
MSSETRFHIASAIRRGSDDLARNWAEIVFPFYEKEKIVKEELAQRSKVAIEVLASLLESGDFDSYSNFFRKIALEWISMGGNISELRRLKKEFLGICTNKFAFLEVVDETPTLLVDELDRFLEGELWQHVSKEYLDVYDAEIGEKARNLPDSNESLKRLLKLTGKLGELFDAGDVWEDLLYEMREIFPSMDAGVVFISINGQLKLRGIAGFEDFVVVKNGEGIDFSFYEGLGRYSGFRVTQASSVKDQSRLIFARRDFKNQEIIRQYPSHILSFPLLSENLRKGLICIFGFDKKNFFSRDEMELIEILASNLQKAIIRSETISSLRESHSDGAFLIELQKKLCGLGNPEELTSLFLKSIDSHIGNTRSVIYLVDENTDSLYPVNSFNTLQKPGTSELSSLYTFALERRSPIFLSSLKDNPIMSGISPPSDLVSPEDSGTMGIIPMVAGNEIVGLWGINLVGIPQFDEGRRLFLTLATNILTYSLKDMLSLLHIKEQHRKRGQEISLAANFQQDLIPRYFRGIGYEIEANLIPGGDLAGDFAFMESRGKDEIIIAIGDVSGRGIAAGMSMMSTYGLLGELSKTMTSPGAVLERLNNRLREQFDKALQPGFDEIFVTCFLINVRKDGLIHYAKAGHPPPIIYRFKQETDEILDARGVPLGIFADSVFEEKETRMEPGDCLVMFSDGITETRDRDNTEFGLDRLRETVKRWKSYPPKIIQNMIAYQIAQFAPRGASGDDRTWIVISREQTGWKKFNLPVDSKRKQKVMTDLIDFIENKKILKEMGVFSNFINEAARFASERGQSEIIVQINTDNESLHIKIGDSDPALKGFEYPPPVPSSIVKFPQGRKSLGLIREDVDFIWYNNHVREINIYVRRKGDEIL